MANLLFPQCFLLRKISYELPSFSEACPIFHQCSTEVHLSLVVRSSIIKMGHEGTSKYVVDFLVVFHTHPAWFLADGRSKSSLIHVYRVSIACKNGNKRGRSLRKRIDIKKVTKKEKNLCTCKITQNTNAGIGCWWMSIYKCIEHCWQKRDYVFWTKIGHACWISNVHQFPWDLEYFIGLTWFKSYGMCKLKNPLFSPFQQKIWGKWLWNCIRSKI